MKEEKEFQTESKELLSLMINSIYSNKEIFLRELISNASDAIDKYKFLQLRSKGELAPEEYFIRINKDKKGRFIEIIDNGIGMNKEDMEKNLGTIARSGSKEFLAHYKELKKEKDVDIIGKFGVGFYSAFMVASKVEVTSRKAGEPTYLFSSDGVDKYSIEEISESFPHGSIVKIYLKKDKDEENYSSYLEEWKIEELVRKYSDFIRYPIKLEVTHSVQDKDAEDKPIEGKYHDEIEDKTLNSMVPLWRKGKKEVKDEDLESFYKSKFYDHEAPLMSLFIKAEGVVEYNSLIYIPAHAPYNLYSDNYEKGLDLYSKGIFIAEKNKDLVPDYLKFIRGLVDSDSFSLNISREMLQKDPSIKKIRENIEKKVLDKLSDIKKNDKEKYEKFFKEFGEFFKWGIYSSYGMEKDKLQDLLVFPSLNEEKLIDLNEYVESMKKDQKNIYFASGKNLESIKLLPQMEKYKKDNINVLLCDKSIDEFALMMIGEYKGHQLKNIATESTEEASEEEKKNIEELEINHRRFLDEAKAELGDKVDAISFSSKLVDSPCCFVTKDGLSLNMEHVLKENPGSQGEDTPKSQKVLEINPNHPLFEAVKNSNDDSLFRKYGKLFYDEAMLLEGYEVEDKKSFVENLNALLLGK